MPDNVHGVRMLGARSPRAPRAGVAMRYFNISVRLLPQSDVNINCSPGCGGCPSSPDIIVCPALHWTRTHSLTSSEFVPLLALGVCQATTLLGSSLPSCSILFRI